MGEKHNGGVSFFVGLTPDFPISRIISRFPPRPAPPPRSERASPPRVAQHTHAGLVPSAESPLAQAVRATAGLPPPPPSPIPPPVPLGPPPVPPLSPMLFYSYFKTLTGRQVTVELKNDVSLTGTLHSVDQYLNVKLDGVRVAAPEKHPQVRERK